MEEKLEEFGLSKNESKIYVSLVELGSVTVKQISDHTNIHRSNIYETLQKMAEKGIVSALMKQGKKYFSANKPECLFSILEHRSHLLKQIMPDLKKLHENHSTNAEHNVDVYQGSSGLKEILKQILLVGEPIYSFGIPKKITEVMKYFIANFHEERIAKEIPIFHLYDEDAKERIDYLNILPFTHAKLLKSDIKSPATTTIFGDYITIWIWSKPEFLLLIKSEAMAKSYKQYFDLLWNMS